MFLLNSSKDIHLLYLVLPVGDDFFIFHNFFIKILKFCL